MNKLNKYFRVIFAIASMLIVSFHSYAHDFEVDGIYYNILTDSTVTVTYKGSSYNDYSNEYTGSVTIPSSVTYNSTTYSVTSIGWSAFESCTGLSSVTIPNSVTTIGNHAFYGCTGLTSITIPNSVISIGFDAFDDTGWYNNQPDGILYLDNCCLGYKGNEPTGTLSIKEGTRLIGYYAFIECSGLTSVTIGNSVTSIGYAAFYNCTGLTSVTIPNSVTWIDSYAFYGCSGLTSVTIGNSVTTIGDDAFSGCSGLTELFIADGTASISGLSFPNSPIETLYLGRNTSESFMENKTSLKKLTIGNSVTTIGSSAFYGCTGLTSVTIGNSVTRIGSSAFYNCTGLTSVTIPNSVTSIGFRAFEYCDGLTEVNITDLSAWCKINFGSSDANPLYYANKLKLNGTEIKDLVIPNDITEIKDYAFECCTGLTSVTIPNSVTTISGYAFYYCPGLTSVTIGNSVTSIGNYAFYDCSGLTSVTIPNSVTSIGDEAFRGCSGLTSVTIPNSVTSIGDEAFRGCTGLTSVTIGNSVTSIGDEAFSVCTGLTEVTIPNSVSSIGNYAFWKCYGLTSVTIGNSVTTIGSSAFRGCSGLTSVTIPNSVTTIKSSAFYDCSGLTSVTIGNSVTTIGDDAFRGCSGLTSVTIGNSVTTIGNYAFYDCSGLTSVTIPNSVTSIGNHAFYNTGWYNNQPDGILYLDNCCLGYKGNKPTGTLSIKEGTRLIGGAAFSHCSGLTSVTIPNSVISIGESAFYSCDGLTEVNITDLSAWCKIDFGGFYANPLYYAKNLKLNGTEIKDLVIPNDITEIKNYAFYGCSGLTSVTIPNSVTSIGDDAFYGCTGLTSITIPNSVTTIGNYAFYDCSGLTSVTIPNSVTSIGNHAFYNTGWYNNQPDGILYLDNCCLGYKGNKPTGTLSIKEGTRLICGFAFEGCTGLTSVTIPNSVTSIGNYAFYYCTGLTSITIPKSVTSIGFDAFDGTGWDNNQPDGILYLDNCCLGYKGNKPTGTLSIKEGTRLICGFAFYGCDVLTSVTIPNSVTTIGYWAFEGCCGLKTIVSLNPTPPVCANSNSFYNYSSATLYVPKDSYAKYFIDDVWGQFTNIKKIEILVSSITLNNSTIELDKGNAATLSATIAPSNATIKNIVWTSSNPQIATVDKSGKVTALLAGAATITAMAIDGSNVSASCKVTVYAETQIVLSQTEASLPVNDIMTLTYTITNSSNKTATWSTSNANVAYIKENSDGSATIVGVADGVATITATANDGSGASASCVVTVGVGGIEGVETDDNAVEVARYDIHGRLLSEPTPGLNIVKMSDGTTRKEIVK